MTCPHNWWELLLCSIYVIAELVSFKCAIHMMHNVQCTSTEFCTCAERSDIMSNSLFFVGEVGGNDYNHLIVRGKSLDELHELVPNVVGAVSSAIMVCMCVSLFNKVIFKSLYVFTLRIWFSGTYKSWSKETSCSRKLSHRVCPVISFDLSKPKRRLLWWTNRLH